MGRRSALPDESRKDHLVRLIGLLPARSGDAACAERETEDDHERACTLIAGHLGLCVFGAWYDPYTRKRDDLERRMELAASIPPPIVGEARGGVAVSYGGLTRDLGYDPYAADREAACRRGECDCEVSELRNGLGETIQVVHVPALRVARDDQGRPLATGLPGPIRRPDPTRRTW